MFSLRSTAVLCTTALLSTLWLSACGDDDATPDSGLPDMVTAPIGPNGGSLEFGELGKVTIPPGALSSQVTIGIGNANELPDLPEGYTRSGSALAFTPHGTNFAVPVTLEIATSGNATTLFRLEDETDTSWDMVEGASFATSGKVIVDVSTFSIYLPARRNSGMIMLDGGGMGGSGGTGGGGTGGSGGTGGTGGSDEDGGTDPVDAGFDAAPPCELTLCNGECVDTTDDGAHCGSCGVSCGAGENCVQSACECPTENRCSVGGDFDAGPSVFNCRDLQNDNHNCGACGVYCDTGDHCVEGACAAIVCGANEDLCGNECINPNTDRDNCGGCGTERSGGSDIPDWYCDESQTYARCGASQRCVSLDDDREHCGDCGNACNNDQACSSGNCFTLECPTDTIPCNGQCIYGATCGVQCDDGFACSAGACAPIVCQAPLVRCGNDCIDPQSDQANCGGCGASRAGEDHYYTCDASDSYCNDECTEYYDGLLCVLEADVTNLCTDANLDRYNCGECGVECAQSEECVFGVCEAMQCDAGEVACDGVCVNGTSCGTNCGGNGSCNAGTCACDSGTVLCADDKGFLGCAHVSDDNYNCGECGNECGEARQCVNGDCVEPPCPGGRIRCDGNCVDITSDEYNCGGCFVPPPNPDTCSVPGECGCEGTECQIGTQAWVCVSLASSEQHCGECGNACANDQACVDGECTTLDCGSGAFCVDRCVDSPICGEECDVQRGFLCGVAGCYQGT